MARVDELQQQVATMEEQLQSSKQMQDQVQQMFDHGLLTSGDGETSYRVVEDPEERERIRAITASKQHQHVGSQHAQQVSSLQQSFVSLSRQEAEDGELFEEAMNEWGFFAHGFQETLFMKLYCRR